MSEGTNTLSENPIHASESEGSRKERLALWADEHLAKLLVIPTLVLLFSMTFYPMIRAIEMSMYQYTAGQRIGFVGLDNYVNLFYDSTWRNSLMVTAWYVFLSVTVQFVVGFVIAVLLNRKLKFRGLIQTLILIPMILAPTVIALVWRLLYAPGGLLDYIFYPIVGGNVGWISDSSIALYSLILTEVWQWTPLVVLVMLAGLQSVPDHLKEAAVMDGASRLRIFWDITLPHMKSLIVLILIIRVIDSIRVFDKVYILTRGGPGESTNVVSMEMYRAAFEFTNWGAAASMAISLLLIVLLIAITFVKIAEVKF
ncbi:carbohydrate ABC transporter permease [Halostagnicola bangensis]